MTKSLYERLGGPAAVQKLARDIVNLHLQNPLIQTRFAASKVEDLVMHVANFIGAGTGGKESYTGRDMPTAHKGMNINERELVAAIDDVLKALKQNGIGEAEQREMLAILYSLKDEVMFQ